MNKEESNIELLQKKMAELKVQMRKAFLVDKDDVLEQKYADEYLETLYELARAEAKISNKIENNRK